MRFKVVNTKGDFLGYVKGKDFGEAYRKAVVKFGGFGIVVLFPTLQ